jgi:hypothetical protein
MIRQYYYTRAGGRLARVSPGYNACLPASALWFIVRCREDVPTSVQPHSERAAELRGRARARFIAARLADPTASRSAIT